MFNVFVSSPVIVCALQLLRACVCDVLDDGDQQTVLHDILPELYKKYRYAVDSSAEAAFTYRRAFNNKEYMIHINRLKSVNGHKKHNLIIKEKSDDNPLIYINNPVETKVPNAYLTLEGFKELLIGRALRQRNEFQQMYKTSSTSKSSIHKPNRVHLTKRNTKQTKPIKYVAPITRTKKMATNTIKTTNAAKAKYITKTKVPLALLLSTNLENTGTTKLNVSEPVTVSSTLLVEAIVNISTTKSTMVVQSAGENKTEETISGKISTEESKTQTPTSRSTGDEFTHITTTEKSSTKEVITEKSIAEKPIEKVTMKKFTIVKHSTVASEITTVDNPIIHDTLEETTKKLTIDSTTETTLNVLRIVNFTKDYESEDIREKEIIEATAFKTEVSSLGETTIVDTSETTAESKESIIVDLSTKLTSMQESTTEPTKEITTEPPIESTTEPRKESTTEPTKEITTEPTRESTTEPTKETTTEPTTETTTEITKETITEPTKQSTTVPTKETTTEQLRPKRKTTTEEPSAESYLPKWTKRTTRPTTTTKATTKRRTLGRPLVYMGGMEEGNQWG